MMQSSLPQPNQSFKFSQRPLAWAALLLLVAGCVIWLLVAQTGWRPDRGQPLPDQTIFTSQTGIRLVRVALTAGGGLVDIHYQVLDPDKAVIVHDRERPPTLLQPRSGVVLNTPFHGHGSRPLNMGVVYRLHLWNTGSALQRGDRVTVTIGDARLDNVLVQ